MSKHLSVDETLDLLNRLRSVISGGAARETHLEHEFQGQMVKERLRRDEAIQAATDHCHAETERLNAALQAAQTAALSTRERRQLLIQKTHRSARKKRLADIEESEGRRKHKLQTETLQLRRNHDVDLAAVEESYSAVQGDLAAADTSLCVLEQSARKAFAGFGRFRRFLSNPRDFESPDLDRDEAALIRELNATVISATGELDRFRQFWLPRFFRFRWIWMFLLVGLSFLPALLELQGIWSLSFSDTAKALGGLVAVGVLLHAIAKAKATPTAAAIARALLSARLIHTACGEKSKTWHRLELERIKAEFQDASQRIDQDWTRTVEEVSAMRESKAAQVDERAARTADRNERLYHSRLGQLDRDHRNALDVLKQEAAALISEAETLRAKNETALQVDLETQWKDLEAEWLQETRTLWQLFDNARSCARAEFPEWDSGFGSQWTAPGELKNAAKFGRLDVDVEALAGAVPKDSRLALPGPKVFTLPLLLVPPGQGAILFETSDSGREEALDSLNNIVLRLLTGAPPGRLIFTVLDPVGLGQSFSALMHLADEAEHLIHGRIWTQTPQIEQRLAILNEHMEKVIQRYLRNEYSTIAEYNEQAGTISEKYHFLVVADFPVGFSDAAARRLLSIAASGARCGVFTLIHCDRRQPLPQDFVFEELRKSSVCIHAQGDRFFLAGTPSAGASLLLDSCPSQDVAIGFLHKVGVSSRDSNRVEVPFSQVAPAESEVWSRHAIQELSVPIGRTGATKLQFLGIGKGTRQHALIAGKTGSGKSTLFHVIITNLSLWFGPDQVEFYLVDFKKGVEFKCYATKRLPHARVVAIESDREFGLSVLQRVDDELRRRGELFRNLGVQHLEGYKKVGGAEPAPRSLLIIDEFQEFFVEDDRISQSASVLLDRIVRQGRAFGIHVLLGSQTLGGAYTMARSTLGQMVIRIALQCNEADAYLIMDDDNPAPRLLSRPGEGIYNDSGGALEGNSPFQTVWLPDEVRDKCLDTVRLRADQSAFARSEPIVFEGNAPANIRENSLLAGLLSTESLKPAAAARIWLGAPNSIKGPTEVVLNRQSGNHLLIVGQHDEAVLSILSIALLSLAAQFRVGNARFIFVDGTPTDSPARDFLERVIRHIPHKIAMPKGADLEEILTGLAAGMKARADDEQSHVAPAIFLIIHDLQKHHKLRYEEDFGFSSGDLEVPAKPGALLNDLICEGARLGIHVIAACDTVNNVNRFLSRKAVSEFELRVLFQMSANDSATLIDSPKASALGLHRAIFQSEQEGYMETFRPYALPDLEWIEEVGRSLARLLR